MSARSWFFSSQSPADADDNRGIDGMVRTCDCQRHCADNAASQAADGLASGLAGGTGEAPHPTCIPESHTGAGYQWTATDIQCHDGRSGHANKTGQSRARAINGRNVGVAASRSRYFSIVR